MIYRVSLKPESSFMFLGENVYESESKKYFENTSMNVPQVSTIFGMLKEEIIKASGLYNSNFIYSEGEKEKIEALIGGFNLGSLENTNHGKLKAVSPLYFKKVDGTNEQFFQRYYLETYQEKKGKSANQESSIFTNDGKKVLVSSFEGLGLSGNAKVYPTSKLIGLENNQEELKLDKILSSHKVPHVKLDYDGHKKVNPGENGRYYVNQVYTLDKKFSFVFDFEFDGELNFKNEYVRMGSRSNIFKINVEEISEDKQYRKMIKSTSKFNEIKPIESDEATNYIIVSENTIIESSLNCTILGEKNSYRSINKYEVKKVDNEVHGKLVMPKTEKLYQIIMPGSIVMFKDDNYEITELPYGLTYIKSKKGENNE